MLYKHVADRWCCMPGRYIMRAVILTVLLSCVSALPPQSPRPQTPVTASGPVQSSTEKYSNENQPVSDEAARYSLQNLNYNYGNISWDDEYRKQLQGPELDIRPLLAFLDLVKDYELYSSVVVITGMSVTEESAKMYKLLGVLSMVERMVSGNKEDTEYNKGHTESQKRDREEFLELTDQIRVKISQLPLEEVLERETLRPELEQLFSLARRGGATDEDVEVFQLLFASVLVDYQDTRILVDPERVRRVQERSWF